jgi:hypothetical protein
MKISNFALGTKRSLVAYWWWEDICTSYEVFSIFENYSSNLWVGNETQNTLKKNPKFFTSSSLYKQNIHKTKLNGKKNSN